MISHVWYSFCDFICVITRPNEFSLFFTLFFQFTQEFGKLCIRFFIQVRNVLNILNCVISRVKVERMKSASLMLKNFTETFTGLQNNLTKFHLNRINVTGSIISTAEFIVFNGLITVILE